MQTDKRTYGDENLLGFWEIAEGYLRCVKKYWAAFGVIIVLATALFGVLKPRVYEPGFCAKVIYAVRKVGDSGVDSYHAKSLSSSLGTVTSMVQFRKELLEEAGFSKGGVGYTLSSEYTEGSNLFTIKVYADDYEKANRLLEALEVVYPSWASKVNGTVELQVMDRTRAMDIPQTSLSRVKTYAIGTLIGCGICLAFATVYIYTVKTIRSEKDMRKITEKNCISFIPDVTQKKRSKKDENAKERLLITYKRIDWGFQQAILTVQSRMEKQMRQNGSQVLLVTSTLPQEGKSVITANLALAFAGHGQNVLVIDGDLRNPSIKVILGEAESSVGLVDYFQRKASLEDMITVCNGISVMDTGSKCSKVSELINEAKMQELMEKCRDRFDMILIDSPPSHLFTDASILHKYADHVLYVICQDMATVKEVEDGIAPFLRSKKLIGYVINRKKEEISAYGKYGYSKYGRYGKYHRYVQLDNTSMNTEDTL